MAIDAKVTFLGQIEKRCADCLTVSDMSAVLGVVSEVLDGYEMRERQGWDFEKDDMLDSYVDAMHVQGRSQQTIDRYVYIIGRFMAHANIPTRMVNVYHVRNWLAAEKNRGVADSTLEGNRQVLSAFFGWLFRESLISKNPMVNIGTIKVPRKKKATYSDIDIAKLNKYCSSVRDKAILNFLSTTGCRISEVTSLDRDAVDLRGCECVVHGKGNKERKVYFDHVTGMLLDDYLRSRTDDSPALFITRYKTRIKPDNVRTMLKKLAEVAGVDHVHPHKFRRTLATELARRGMPIQEIARVLGHDKLETTMRYVNINDDDVKNDYRKYA